MNKLIFLPLLVLFTNVNAQVGPPPDYALITKSAQKFISDGQWEEAYREYKKIHRNDTNYANALANQTLILLDAEKYDQAIETSKEGLKLKSIYNYNFYVNLSVALLRNKSYEKSLEIINEALTKYPKSFVLLYNKATALNALNKHEEALLFFKKTIQLNPFFPKGHLSLGLMALEEGKISQAMLALNTFLILDPYSETSFSVLQKLNEISAARYTGKPVNLQLSPEGKDDFTETDLILNNYAALSKSYKIPLKTDLPAIKQNHALISQLKVDMEDKGFWSTTYVPLFDAISKENKFNDFSCTILGSSTHPDLKKLVKKNEEGVKSFSGWIVPYIEKMQGSSVSSFDGKINHLQNYYNSESHFLNTIGIKNSTGKLTGYTEVYNSNGDLSSYGLLNDQQEKTGLWKTVNEEHIVVEEVNYKNGKIDGSFRIFYPDGTLKREGYYKDGLQQGIQKDYNIAGRIIEEAHIKNDLLDGEYTNYYSPGAPYIHHSGKYFQGKIQDTIRGYDELGKLSFTRIYLNGIMEGKEQSYFSSQSLNAEFSYLNNHLEGNYISYHENGKVHKSGQYRQDKLKGKLQSYSEDGTLLDDENYNDNGVLEGEQKYYDSDGLLASVITYNSKGDIVSYKYLNKQGNVIFEDQKKKPDFNYTGYFPTGEKKVEGVLHGSHKKGKWKYSDRFGNLTKEENFQEGGELDGKATNYYSNGKIQQETYYNAGSLEGSFISYYADGSKSQEGWYHHGELDGEFITYYPNGTIKSRDYYMNGKQHGYQQEYYTNGQLKEENFTSENGLERTSFFDTSGVLYNTIALKNATGEFIRSYQNGRTEFTGSYVVGQLDGPYTWYYPNGKVQVKGEYRNGWKVGQWIWYYDSGKIRIEGYYSDNTPDNTWKYYYENSMVEKSLHYQKGMLTGESKWFDFNGKLETVKTFRNNEEWGEAFSYGSNGEIIMVRNYMDGKPYSYAYPDKTGKMNAPIDISSGNYKVNAFYRSGSKAKEYEVKNGLYNGKAFIYYDNGSVKEESNYQNDLLEGENKEYYSNGKIKSVAQYHLGELNGSSKFYDDDGKLEKEEHYLFNDLEGKSDFYSKAGKLITSKWFRNGSCISEKNY